MGWDGVMLVNGNGENVIHAYEYTHRLKNIEHYVYKLNSIICRRICLHKHYIRIYMFLYRYIIVEYKTVCIICGYSIYNTVYFFVLIHFHCWRRLALPFSNLSHIGTHANTLHIEYLKFTEKVSRIEREVKKKRERERQKELKKRYTGKKAGTILYRRQLRIKWKKGTFTIYVLPDG